MSRVPEQSDADESDQDEEERATIVEVCTVSTGLPRKTSAGTCQEQKKNDELKQIIEVFSIIQIMESSLTSKEFM